MNTLPEINGYQLLRPFTTAGGGMSKWTFARKEGREYFLKEFLYPTWPSAGAPGGADVKLRKKQECLEFEKHHNAIMRAIAGSPLGGGNLIATHDFFLHGSKYYKVTEKVDVTTLELSRMLSLPLRQRLLILATVSHSVRTLHRLRIVHGDLKRDNILIKQLPNGNFASKLIDFDNSFFDGNPPAVAEEMVGDMVYFSPEQVRYLRGEAEAQASALTLSSDIFALGLLFSEYLTGQLPHYHADRFRFPSVAVNCGERLVLPLVEVAPDVRVIVNEMLHYNPDKRPGIERIFATLRTALGTPETATRPNTVVNSPQDNQNGEAENFGQSGRLKGTLFKK